MRRLNGMPRHRPIVRRWQLALCLAVPAVLAAVLHREIRHAPPPDPAALLAQAQSSLMATSTRLGLRVEDIEVVGRHTTDPATIVAALGARRGTPIFAVDPQRAAERLDALPWVRSAIIERRLPDTLFVRLVERHPLALWQHAGKIQLIDRRGGVIPVPDLGRFSKLPMVVGADAAPRARKLLDMLAKEPRLAARVTVAERVGGRRWNLRLKDGITVMLPAEDPEAAWSELARLQKKQAILKRNVETIDLRLPDRLVFRVATPPASGDSKKKGRPVAKKT